MDQPQEVVTILFADTYSLFREAVKAVLDNEPDLHLVAQARDGRQAVEEAERVRPHVALLDADLPNGDGVRATALIKERVPDCKVVVLANDEDTSVLVRALEAGASGYLTKECPLSELIDAARAVHRGDTLVPKQMLGALLARLIRRRREQDEAYRKMARLTRREREVLSLLSGGADNDDIAKELVISPQTARTHIQNILYKLGVHTRLEAAAFVIQSGVVSEFAGLER